MNPRCPRPFAAHSSAELCCGYRKYPCCTTARSGSCWRPGITVGRIGHRIQLAFTYGSSDGMNLVALLLAKRGEVLAPAGEFPSATLPWLQ